GIKPKSALTLLGKDLIHYPRETEMMATYFYETSDPVILSKEEIAAYRLFSLDEQFFTNIVPNLKITPDFQFIINTYLKRFV
ncbi:MAG: hypothetical protein Q7R79_04655, partial [bacterium]|nr:hypothetical protein [bacterium]